MYPECYYNETEKWREDYREALKQLDELYPETKAYIEEAKPSTVIKGSYNTIYAPGLRALFDQQSMTQVGSVDNTPNPYYNQQLQNMSSQQLNAKLGYGLMNQQDRFNQLAGQVAQQSNFVNNILPDILGLKK